MMMLQRDIVDGHQQATIGRCWTFSSNLAIQLWPYPSATLSPWIDYNKRKREGDINKYGEEAKHLLGNLKYTKTVILYSYIIHQLML